MSRYRFQPAPPALSVAPTPLPLSVAPTDLSVLCSSALETQFPRILNAIQDLWGYPELNRYFNQLTVSERSGREGFPAEVWEEIYLLMSVHESIVPTKP